MSGAGGPYRRVPADDSAAAAAVQGSGDAFADNAGGGGVGGSHPAGSSASASAPSFTRTNAERLSDKLHALVWMGCAFAVAHYTDLIGVLLHDPRILRPVFYSALGLLGINVILTLYLAVYLPRFKGIRDCTAWDAYCPKVIPTITGVGVLCGFLLLRSLWPVWGVLTPLVLGVESMGALFSLHFVPWL